MVFELHDMRIVCLLEAVTPDPRMGYKHGFIHVINRPHSSFRFVWGITSHVQCLLSVGPARPVPRALNKHYSARAGPINVSFMYIT